MSCTPNNCKTENKAQLERNCDFISFNRSPSSNFTPPHYSSPLKAEYYKKNKLRDNRNFNPSDNSSGSYSESSHNNSYTRRYSSSQRYNYSSNCSGSYSENFSAHQYFPQGSNHSNNYSGSYSESFSEYQYLPQGSNQSNNYSGNYSGNISNKMYSTNKYSSQKSGTTKHERDISCYLHPSFMEDPWKRLEEEYSQKTNK